MMFLGLITIGSLSVDLLNMTRRLTCEQGSHRSMITDCGFCGIGARRSMITLRGGGGTRLPLIVIFNCCQINQTNQIKFNGVKLYLTLNYQNKMRVKTYDFAAKWWRRRWRSLPNNQGLRCAWSWRLLSDDNWRRWRISLRFDLLDYYVAWCWRRRWS